jgi:poly(beta-D-mannuronate) lyase
MPPRLRSPWDTLPEPQTPEHPFTCSPPLTLPVVIQVRDYYSDQHHSVVDPARKHAYEQAMEPLRRVSQGVVGMADAWRTNGDPAIAACAADWLTQFALTGAMTGPAITNQAAYVQGWILGSLALAWLKIRTAAVIPRAKRATITAWLARIAMDNLRYYETRPAHATDSRNNHRYWAGLAVMAAGIAADRRTLFQWGIDSFRIGVAQITPEGTLPLEMARRSLALHYHLFAAAPLVAIAELAAANGIDLYPMGHYALARLVHRAASGLQDSSFFARQAGVAQQPVLPDAYAIAWAIPFARRFPDVQLSKLIARVRSRSILFLGGIPPP